MRKVFAVFIPLLMAFSCMLPVSAEGEDFDTFLENEFREMMEDDYLALHFDVKDYHKLGLTKPEVTFGSISVDDYPVQTEKYRDKLDALHAFDYESLDDRQQHDYLVYEDYLEDNLALSEYWKFEEMFNPYNGTQSDLITMLTEFVFYDRESLDDYLVLLQDVPRIYDEMMAFTDEQIKAGYFMRDKALEKELSQLDEFIAKGDENPLYVIFNKNIEKLEGLTAEEVNAYKEENRRIVSEQVLPAHSKVRDYLASKKGSRSIDGPVCSFPDGQEYYEALAAFKTSSDESLQEKLDLMIKGVHDAYDYLTDLLLNVKKDPVKITTPDTPETILEYLRTHMEDFPKGPEVNYEPSYLDPSVANPAVMAYYMTTPVDDLTDNIIRINADAVKGDLTTLYYTLAHEGFPGHLYQFTWYQSQGENPLRHEVSVIGYQEGWAQYVEKIMLNRAPIDFYSSEIHAVNTFVGYVLQAVADIAVNGMGCDKAGLDEVFGKAGLKLDENAVGELYDAVIDMPGMILPYGYGMAKFWEYRERVQSALGDEFDLEDFHLQLLKNGPRSFDILEDDLKKYVASKGKTMPDKFEFFASERPDGMISVNVIISFIQQHPKTALAIGIGILLILLLILYLIIRGVIRIVKLVITGH